MQACCLWSCSSINITLTYYIIIIGFVKINKKRLIHHDWRDDLSVNHLHTNYLVHLDTFVEHFSPHQFWVATLGECQTMVHGVKTMLDLHSKWVVL
jgi:hypothetical protein